MTAEPQRRDPLTEDDVAPELRAKAARRAVLALVERRVPRTLGRWVVRWLLPKPRVAGAHVTTTRTLSGVGVRRYEPEVAQTDAVLLWIHGGGYVVGAPAMDERLVASTAAELGMRVESVDYRLAPDHPFPTPLDDCRAVWDALQEDARRAGTAPARVVVGGLSAGGGLAAALVQQLADASDVQPLGQWLFCPMLDDRTAADRSLDDVGHFVWDNRCNRGGWRAYLGQEPGAEQVPAHAVPARRDHLSGLPPAWIGVGDIDLFHDEDLAYAARLRDAGVDVTTSVVPGGPHGFETLVPDAPLSATYLDGARAWLRSVVGA